MDWFMNGVLVALVSAATGGWIASMFHRARRSSGPSKSGAEGSASEELADQRLRTQNNLLQNEVGAMRDRLMVLEKIVTDRGYTLADEIEALRERRENSAAESASTRRLNEERV